MPRNGAPPLTQVALICAMVLKSWCVNLFNEPCGRSFFKPKCWLDLFKLSRFFMNCMFSNSKKKKGCFLQFASTFLRGFGKLYFLLLGHLLKQCLFVEQKWLAPFETIKKMRFWCLLVPALWHRFLSNVISISLPVLYLQCDTLPWISFFNPFSSCSLLAW